MGHRPKHLKRIIYNLCGILTIIDWFTISKKAKQLNLDAIHDSVHEMTKDEARHGRALKALLDRYFK